MIVGCVLYVHMISVGSFHTHSQMKKCVCVCVRACVCVCVRVRVRVRVCVFYGTYGLSGDSMVKFMTTNCQMKK